MADRSCAQPHDRWNWRAPRFLSDLSLRRLGTFRLKDLLAPELVFQVEATGLPSQFAGLRTLDAAHHNLPVQRTRLVGRDGEVAAVRDALNQGRLVTLTGVGGCGKTRLALAVAAEIAEDCKDGVFFVALAHVTHEDGVLPAVIEAMGVRLANETAADLARYLEHRDIVVVLDNCETLLDEIADLVDAILSNGDGPRVLATSREALGAEGERVFRVPSLRRRQPGW